jgi:tetratricopeptide (TPR) repeat protein
LAASALSLHCVPAPAPPLAPEVERGQLSLARGEPQAALKAFRSALAANPDDGTARMGLVTALLARAESGDGEIAVEEWNRLKGGDSGEARALGCRALELAAGQALADDHDEQAFAQLADHEGLGCPLASRTPLAAASFMTRASRLDAEGDAVLAQSAWASARDLDPKLSDAYLLPAERLLSSGRIDPALELLAAGLEQHPNSGPLAELMVEALGIRYSEPASEQPPLPP